MLRSKYSFRKIFEDFKRTHPYLRKDVIYWRPHGFSTIEIWFVNGEKATYNDYDRKVNYMEERWKQDEQQKKGSDDVDLQSRTHVPIRTRRERRHEEMEGRKRYFSSHLIEQMKLAGMSQKELAEELMVSKQAMSAYVNGKRLPDPNVIEEIADILNIDISRLIDW